MSAPDGGDGAGIEVRRRLFAQIARGVVGASPREPLPLRLCRMFVEATAADGGAITLASTRPERTTLCATDGVAGRLEDLQEVLGQGPGSDAFVSGVAVAGDLSQESDDRWAVFADAARAAVGPVTLRAFPMRTPLGVLGVITVHRHGTWVCAASEDAELGLLADAIGSAIVHDSPHSWRAPAWGARDRINQATGMVVAQLGVGPGDALALMRAFAFSHEVGLQQVADEVLARWLDFSEDVELP